MVFHKMVITWHVETQLAKERFTMKQSKFVQAIAAANLLISSHAALAKGPLPSQKFAEEAIVVCDLSDDTKLMENNSGCGNSGCGNKGCNK